MKKSILHPTNTKIRDRNRLFYLIKPFVPRRLQIFLRKRIAIQKRFKNSHLWPINEKIGKKPKGWYGWPEQKRFALVLTHDVETAAGLEKCRQLMKYELEFGFRSSFNFVPEKYNVSQTLLDDLNHSGFEVGVHGLKHDGRLYGSQKIFNERAKGINHYLKMWKAVGFRSPAMLRNLDWIHNLNIEYDSSTFDVDPFEPQPDGVNSIFPFRVPGYQNSSGYTELPYTLPQDHLLFIILKEKNIEIWKKKLDWIVEHGGMALLVTHPDYMNFSSENLGWEEYPVKYYLQFLEYVKTKYEGLYWHALPRVVARSVHHHLNEKKQSQEEGVGTLPVNVDNALSGQPTEA